MTIAILGAGLAGLSCSYHLGHKNCIIFEKNSHDGGHIYSHHVDECVWDEGPHISFTRNEYVRKLFEESTLGEFYEYEATIGNWYNGNWIPHPAQTNLYAVPKDIRKRCLEDFLASREQNQSYSPQNYGQWLQQAFGTTFAETFPAQYTRKYWTCEPEQLGTDWIGERVHYPNVDSVKSGYHGPPQKAVNYISRVRYPKRNGFYSYASKLRQGANIKLNKQVQKISLKDKTMLFKDGTEIKYECLINTIPLDKFVNLTNEAPQDVRNAAAKLNCTSVLLVNITGKSQHPLPYHWLYVYDEDLLSTRITQNQLLSPYNMKSEMVGLQVEVYSSKYKPLRMTHQEISAQVSKEVVDMGLVDEVFSLHTRFVEYANIIFDLQRMQSQAQIFEWLSEYGLKRSKCDLNPMTDWENTEVHELSAINLAGRFGEWKYHWSDDCILRGKQLSKLA